ncbi:MAG: hypothetical protein U0175_30330 [Caldilineaceae bacterium]
MRRLRQLINPYLLLVWGLSLFALVPLLSPGYFYNAHDGRHSVFYQIMFDAAFRDGAWWPRWAMHHAQGYGYPTFVLQAPVGFYLGELFVLLGASFTNAVKLVWSAGFMLSGWGMYELMKWWGRGDGEIGSGSEGNKGGTALVPVLVALLYVYLPYRLVDAYVRGALNDTLLLAWFPWAFLAFDRLLVFGNARGWQRRLAWAILALGGTLLTHTFALLSFTPLLVTFVLFRLLFPWRLAFNWRYNLPRLLLGAAGGVGGLLLSMVFLIPLLAEGPTLQQQVYVSGSYDFRNHFVFWGQFLAPFWGYGYSDDPTGANDGMSFQLGALLVILCVAVVVMGRWGDRKIGSEGERQKDGVQDNHREIFIYLVVALMAILAMMTPLSRPLWEAVPPLAVIQFPWRLLTLAGFIGSALVGVGLIRWGLQIDIPPSAIRNPQSALLSFCLLTVFASTNFVDPPLQPVEPWREDGRAVAEFERQHPDMMPYTQWSAASKFTQSPMTADYESPNYHEDHGFTHSLTRLSIVKGDGEVTSVYSGGSSGGGSVRMVSPGVVTVNIQNFPGWQVRIDGQPVVHRISTPGGLLEVDVPTGEHRIDARMGSTPDRLVGTIISWSMVLVIVGLLV